VSGVTTPSLTDAPIRSPLALTRRWVEVLQLPVFDSRSLWLTWFGADGRQAPIVVPVDDLSVRPDRRVLAGLLDVHRQVAGHLGDAEAHLAMALCRPGEPVATDADDAWASALYDVLDDALDGTWSLHLAAGGRVEPLVEAPSFFSRVTGDGVR
jgi:hypothetical protein